jgi:diaminopimelate epimerase
MDKTIQFIKMHGLGNDFIVVDGTKGPLPAVDLAELARKMCDRHFGIGADGLIFVMPSTVADFRMHIYNADGSIARMCGNGSRCVGKFIHDCKLSEKESVTLETLGGIKVLHLKVEDGEVNVVTVDMGEPSTANDDMLQAEVETPYINKSTGKFNLTAISMGNPHGVIFVDNVAEINLKDESIALQNNPIWLDSANIEFVEIKDRSHARVRVWERGSGETMACGTGACASTIAGVLNGLLEREVTITLPGGDCTITWETNNHVMLTGTVHTVFHGDYPLPKKI